MGTCAQDYTPTLYRRTSWGFSDLRFFKELDLLRQPHIIF